MSNSLPQYVNPWLLFRTNETVNGTIDLSAMPNLQSVQDNQSGAAHASISVVQREDNAKVIQGQASTTVTLECQRCLQPLEQKLEADFELVVVKYERQLSTLRDEDDGIVVEEQLELLPLVEQELILALPMIAKHDDCEPHYKNSETGTENTQQPFSQLKDLLN